MLGAGRPEVTSTSAATNASAVAGIAIFG